MRRPLLLAAATAVALTACYPSAPHHTTLGPRMPDRRTEVAGAFWADEGLIAVAGGFARNGQPTSRLDLFDVAGGAWSVGTALPGNYDHASLAFLDGSLWLVGGYKAGSATAETWRLDSPGGPWVARDSLGTPRGALATVAVSGRLVAIGGANSGGVLKSTEVYDPGPDAWSPGPDLNVAREHTAAAVVGSTVYAIAGRQLFLQTNLTSVESLAFPAGTWQMAPSLRYARGGIAAGTAAGRACVAGGEQPGGTIPPIECLKPAGWKHVANMRKPRHGLAVVGVGDRLHMIAGGPKPGLAFSGKHEILSL